MTPERKKDALKLIAIIITATVSYTFILGSGLDVEGKIFAAFCEGAVSTAAYFMWGGKV